MNWLAPELRIGRGGHDLELLVVSDRRCVFCETRTQKYVCHCGLELCKICAF